MTFMCSEPEDLESEIRTIFGMKSIRDESSPPPVDANLLRRFLGQDDLDDESFALLLDNLERYACWRLEYKKLVLESGPDLPSPPPPISGGP